MPTPEGTARTCSSEGAPQAPLAVFIHPEGGDTIEDGEIIGILAEDQLKLRALCLKDNQLQKQKELLAANRERIKHASQNQANDTGRGTKGSRARATNHKYSMRRPILHATSPPHYSSHLPGG
jgi:hypothetical protein